MITDDVLCIIAIGISIVSILLSLHTLIDTYTRGGNEK